MPISFKPLARLIPLSRLKHRRIVGGATYDMIRSAVDNPITGGVSISAIDAICAYLGVQPGDVIEYVPDEAGRPAQGDTGPTAPDGDMVDAASGPGDQGRPADGHAGPHGVTASMDRLDKPERAVQPCTDPTETDGSEAGEDGPDEPREGEHGAQTGRRGSRRGDLPRGGKSSGALPR